MRSGTTGMDGAEEATVTGGKPMDLGWTWGVTVVAVLWGGSR